MPRPAESLKQKILGLRPNLIEPVPFLRPAAGDQIQESLTQKITGLRPYSHENSAKVQPQQPGDRRKTSVPRPKSAPESASSCFELFPSAEILASPEDILFFPQAPRPEQQKTTGLRPKSAPERPQRNHDPQPRFRDKKRQGFAQIPRVKRPPLRLYQTS